MPSPWRWSHSKAILLPVPVFVAGDPVFALLPVIPVDPAAVSVSLAFAGISVPHPEAILKDPFVAAVFHYIVAVALVPFGVVFVAGDPEFLKILVIPVDIAAAGLETLPIAFVSVPHRRAILPDPIAFASSSEGREEGK